MDYTQMIFYSKINQWYEHKQISTVSPVQNGSPKQ